MLRWRIVQRGRRVKERILRKLMPSRMNVFPYDWPLLRSVCPCDEHFCDYLKERAVARKSIFHFGSGGHHLVGLRNKEDGLENDILAITASPIEHARYVKWIIRDPVLGRHYKVLFADIYNLSASSLPEFDVVTLFHLCEYTPPANGRDRMDDAGVLGLFRMKLASQGRLLLYEGSDGRRRTEAIIERAVANGTMAFEEQYKSLLVFRVFAAQ